MKKILIFAVACLVFSGCASIFSGTTQIVAFESAPGTKIYKDGMKIAEIDESSSVTIVEIDRSISSKVIVAKNERYYDTHVILKPKVNEVVFLNFLTGPYFFLGGAIDCATGAAGKLPKHVYIEMEEKK